MPNTNADLASPHESGDHERLHASGDGITRHRHLFAVGGPATAGVPGSATAFPEEQRGALADTPRPRRRPVHPARIDFTAASVEEVVQAASDGDTRAWDELVRRYGRLVWAVARAQGLNEADGADVYQVVWLQLVNHLGRIRDPQRVGSWLATTARYECYSTLRRRGRVVPVADLGVDDGPALLGLEAADDDGRIEAIDRSDCVGPLAAIVATLSERQRALVTMLMLDPAPSYREISDAIGIPIGSIGPTRQRILALLRRKCDDAGLSFGDE